MQGVTLIVAIIFSLLAIRLRPVHALISYIISLLWYPSYLMVSIGTIDLKVSRFVVLVLLIRCLFDKRILNIMIEEAILSFFIVIKLLLIFFLFYTIWIGDKPRYPLYNVLFKIEKDQLREIQKTISI